MKEIKKLSLSNVISKLTRNEMRYVMAGSGTSGDGGSCCARQWRDYSPPLTGQYSSVACDLSSGAAQSFAAGGR